MTDPLSDPLADTLTPDNAAKLAAARAAVSEVRDGMRLGLGTGSTAAWMVRCLGQMVREEGLHVLAVPTSQQTESLARAEGISVVTLDEAKWLDLTIDGADEVDGHFNLIKGGGGALLQEKIVATASDRMIVIADASKQVAWLGTFPLPVEVIPFGWRSTKGLVEESLESLDVQGVRSRLRMEEETPFVTDHGNYILDLELQRIGNARQLSFVLNQIPGVVENGLFLDICDEVIIGHADGHVLRRNILGDAANKGEGDTTESGNIFADLG